MYKLLIVSLYAYDLQGFAFTFTGNRRLRQQHQLHRFIFVYQVAGVKSKKKSAKKAIPDNLGH